MEINFADPDFLQDPYEDLARLRAQAAVSWHAPTGRFLAAGHAAEAAALLAAAGGEFDLLADVAEPLAVTVIAELLGVPAADRHRLRPWSANRDPAVFAGPDDFDVGRDPNPHLSFGAGLHFCLGAPLARIELPAGLAALLDHAPALALTAEPVTARRSSCVVTPRSR